MDHNTGKSRKLNDNDMMQMQTLASEILSMERGQSKTETIEQLQTNIKQMEVEHSRAMMIKDNEHRKALEAKETEHKDETNTLNSIINTAHRWYPDFAHLLRLERLAKQIGLSAMEFAELIKGKVLNFTGRLFSSEHNRWFATENTPLQILRDNDKRLTLTANRIYPSANGLTSNTTNCDNHSVSLYIQKEAKG